MSNKTNTNSKIKPDVKWAKFGRIAYIFAIISGLATLGMTIAAMVQTLPQDNGTFSIWSMASQDSKVTIINNYARMGTYGMIVALVLGVLTIGISTIQFRNIMTGKGTSLLMIIIALFLASAADAVSVAGIVTATQVTDFEFLQSHGAKFGPIQ